MPSGKAGEGSTALAVSLLTRAFCGVFPWLNHCENLQLFVVKDRRFRCQDSHTDSSRPHHHSCLYHLATSKSAHSPSLTFSNHFTSRFRAEDHSLQIPTVFTHSCHSLLLTNSTPLVKFPSFSRLRLSCAQLTFFSNHPFINNHVFNSFRSSRTYLVLYASGKPCPGYHGLQSHQW